MKSRERACCGEEKGEKEMGIGELNQIKEDLGFLFSE
jgi:hypothetical protein